MNLENKGVRYNGRAWSEKREGRNVMILQSQKAHILMKAQGPEKEEDVMVLESDLEDEGGLPKSSNG